MNYLSIKNEHPQDLLNQYSKELVDDLLLHDSIYPWDLKDLETEEYINNLENQFSDNWTNQELENKAQSFFSRLNQCWDINSNCNIYNVLSEQFGSTIPHNLLENISVEINKVITLNINPMERLIQCVKPLLSQWSEVDLQVFARPLVFAMRGDFEPEKDMVNSLMENKKWQDLSEVEQAKVTLAIAQYTLELN